MLSAFGEEVLSGFRNSFGKYFGTDHMLLEGWRSYLTHLRTRPDDGTIPVCFHSGAMAMFPTMLEIFSTGGKEQALKRLKDADGPSRLWEEYRACLADEIDAEILDQYKKAFYGGTWFIIATFMALADEKRDEHFIRGMEALRDEISEFRTDLKQWIIREAGKPRDYQAPETVLRTKREGPVKIDPVEALVRQAVSMNWKQVHEIKKEDVAADDFAQAMVSIRFARGNEEAVVRRKDATVTLVRRHAPPTFDGFDELEEWVAENPENNGDGIVSDEALYLREIEKNVTRLGHFDTLLEAQGTDKKFFLACAKYHKAAYVAEESATLVAALTLEALRRYRSDRAWGISCLAGLERDCKNR